MKTTILTITEIDTDTMSMTATAVNAGGLVREILRVEIPPVAEPSKAFVAIVQAIDGLDKPKKQRKSRAKTAQPA